MFFFVGGDGVGGWTGWLMRGCGVDFLRANNTGSRVRIISDNCRFELSPSSLADDSSTTRSPLPPSPPSHPSSSQGLSYNHTAGESLTRFVRSHPSLSRIPILIHCGSSIGSTRYVERYGLCGSTVDSGVVGGYLDGLKEGLVDDEGWRGFDRGWLGSGEPETEVVVGGNGDG